jgi:hypothetical protein
MVFRLYKSICKNVCDYIGALNNLITSTVSCTHVHYSNAVFCRAGVRMHRSVLLSTERSPDANQTRHRADVTQHQLPAKGVAHLLRSDPTRSDLDIVLRRATNGDVQIQIRRHGRSRVRVSVKDVDHDCDFTSARALHSCVGGRRVGATILDRFRRRDRFCDVLAGSRVTCTSAARTVKTRKNKRTTANFVSSRKPGK